MMAWHQGQQGQGTWLSTPQSRCEVARARTHLPLGGCDCSPAGINVLINARQEILGDSEGILKQWVVWVVHRCVLQQILGKDVGG